MTRSAIRTDYHFLARPVQPLPPLPSSPESTPAQATHGSRRRSSTFSAIASWAAHVQPGSPASLSPRSPYPRPSLCKDRRPSLASIRIPSASFLHIASTPTTAFAPTPSIRNFKADLTTVGYTSVFLQLPNTPVSASLSFSVKPTSPNNITVPAIPSAACKSRGFTRFRSLSILRPRGRSKSACPDSTTKMKAKTAVAATKCKKAKYAMRPPLLANELALMQFIDGGNMDDNIKRVMEAQAKASDVVGLADAYRDGEGGIWWDQDEEWEYTHLLSVGDESRPHATGGLQWVTFDENTSPSMPGVAGESRRGSVSTQDSDLDPKYVVQPVDSLDGDDLALLGSAVMPLTTRQPPVSDLSLPSRPCRTTQHLRKPDFLADVAFSRPHASPKSPRNSSTGMQLKGKARRRPAPLKLSPPSPAFKRATNSPIDTDKVRKDFIDASFDPARLVPATPTTPATTPVEVCTRLAGNSRAINAPWRTVYDGLTSLGMKKKPSMLNIMGLFRSARNDGMIA